LTIDVETKITAAFTVNIIADTLTGDGSSVIVVGSHLDGVRTGPGINDNGSGSALNLELALLLSNCLNSKHRIRFAWWGAEELGLVGSTFYVSNLTMNHPEELKKIKLNINLDMVASPNSVFGIYNGSSAAEPIREKSTLIQREFEAFFTRAGHSFKVEPFTGRSDYGPFIEAGIPAGGLFTGAEVVKNAIERTNFGGLANAAYDPCYHEYCDSYENLSIDTLNVNAEASQHVLLLLDEDTQLVNHIANNKLATPSSPYLYPTHPDAISRF